MKQTTIFQREIDKSTIVNTLTYFWKKLIDQVDEQKVWL